MDYQAIANTQREVDEDFFGEPTQEAENLKVLLLKLKEEVPDFLGETCADDEGRLKSLVFSTPLMKDLAQNFMDLLVMDTTFNTNRFRMRSLTLCGKDNNNKTSIFAQALLSQETTEQFAWALNTIKKYFDKSPDFILIDADPALINTAEEVFNEANIKLCGWHCECNFKNHLYGSKKS